MSGKFAFAAFVAALFALTVFTAVQAQAHLQPRDALPTQNNSTQDHILPRDDLTSAYFANTSDTSGEKSKRTLIARNPTPPLRIPLTKSSTLQYTGRISVELDHPGLIFWEDFRVVFSTVARDDMWLVSDTVRTPHFEHKFNHTGLWCKTGSIDVKAFGGSGAGPFYETRIKIDHLNLGATRVGALQQIRGFGGEVGDGVVPLARLSTESDIDSISDTDSTDSKSDSDSISGIDTKSGTAWQKLIGLRAYPRNAMAIALRLNRGELHIGMIDQAAYDGDIQYHKCDQSSPLWAINDAIIRVGFQPPVKNQRIIFDTTSQFIRGPKSTVQKIYDGDFFLKYKRTFYEELGLFRIPCDENMLPKIQVSVEPRSSWTTKDKLFKQSIPTHPGLCFGLLAVHTENTLEPPAGPHDWLIPLPMDHYTIFDWVEGKMGFAKLKPGYRPDIQPK